MKKPILIFLILIVGLSSFSQAPLIVNETNIRLLKKSNRKKTTAIAFVGVGAIVLAAGISMNNNYSNFEEAMTGPWLMVFGGELLITSIPFFYSASKNKKRAMSVAVSQQSNNMQWKPSNISGMQTAISLKFNLGK